MCPAARTSDASQAGRALPFFQAPGLAARTDDPAFGAPAPRGSLPRTGRAGRFRRRALSWPRCGAAGYPGRPTLSFSMGLWLFGGPPPHLLFKGPGLNYVTAQRSGSGARRMRRSPFESKPVCARLPYASRRRSRVACNQCWAAFTPKRNYLNLNRTNLLQKSVPNQPYHCSTLS